MAVIPGGVQRIKDYQTWQNISATPTDFDLNSGVFALALHATAWGTGVQLKKLVQDGSSPANTYVPVSPVITADGYVELHLSAGQYQLAFGTTAGLTGEIAKIGAWR